MGGTRTRSVSNVRDFKSRAFRQFRHHEECVMYSTRKCTNCKQEKPESSFYFKNKIKNILQSKCKECSSLSSKQHYKKNKDIYKKRARKNNTIYLQRNKEFIDNYKINKCCEICGESHPACLDFHHTDPNIKEKNISRMKVESYSISTIKREIEKCIVVCSNCHRKIHYSSGIDG